MKALFENWRRFVNEEENEEDVKKALDSELDQEGGAAGLDPLVAAAKEKDPDITKDEVKHMLDAMSNVGQHEEGDYVDKAQLEEAVNIFLEAKEDLLDEKRKRKKKKKKKKKRDACYSKVKARYKVWPSAYASGALVKCRKVGAANWGTGGKKKKKNESLSLEDMIREEIQNVLDEACWETHKQVGMKKKDGRMVPNCVPKEGLSKQELEEEENSLNTWFSQNKGKGWVDCKTGKPCGRQKGEKRKGYPACRPTMAQCTEKGKRAKKSSKEVEWE